MNNLKILIIVISLLFMANANWQLQYPWPNINKLTDVVLVNNESIMAVGELGIVIQTNNKGNYWKRILVDSNCTFNSIEFWDSLNGIICGDTNMLYTTNNAGITWSSYKLKNSHAFDKLDNLLLIDSTNGWLTINKSILLNTKDAGKSWDSIYTFSENVTLLKFMNDNIGWAITDSKDSTSHSNFYMTKNGGINWIKKLSNIIPDINTIVSYDSSNYGLVGIHFYGYKIPYPHPFVIVTSDNGGSYDTVNFVGFNSNKASYAIHSGYMLSKDSISIIAEEQKNYYCVKNGTSWNATHTNNSLPTIKHKQIKDEFGTAINENGNLIYTQNGGKQWKELKNGSSIVSDLTNITFLNSKIGWASGYKSNAFTFHPPKGILFKTLDGGERWKKLSIEFDRAIVDLEFASPNIGWLIFGDGNNLCNLRKSTDGGLSWTSDTRGSGLSKTIKFQSIDFLSEKIGFIIGQKEILKTTDGGTTWIKQNIHCSDTSFTLRKINVISNSLSWIRGDSGLLLFSNDGGANWYERYIQFPGKIGSISFIDSKQGWISTRNKIFKTTDGGITWIEIPIPNDMEIFKLLFVNSKQGYAIYRDLSYVTSDGGISWTIEKNNLNTTYTDITSPDYKNIWVSGSHNGIYHRVYNNEVSNSFLQQNSGTNTNNAIKITEQMSSMNIEFILSENSSVSLSVYTLNGKLIKQMSKNKYMRKGNRLINIDKTGLPKGSYILCLESNEFKSFKPIVIF